MAKGDYKAFLMFRFDTESERNAYADYLRDVSQEIDVPHPRSLYQELIEGLINEWKLILDGPTVGKMVNLFPGSAHSDGVAQWDLLDEEDFVLRVQGLLTYLNKVETDAHMAMHLQHNLNVTLKRITQYRVIQTLLFERTYEEDIPVKASTQYAKPWTFMYWSNLWDALVYGKHLGLD